MIETNPNEFPVREETIYLNNCGVAPLYGPAADAVAEFMSRRARQGAGVFAQYGRMASELRSAAAELLGTTAENVAFTKNTAEGISMLASGFRFKNGDEIISFVHEYPSNHFPWRLQERRGVRLRLLPNRICNLDADSPAGQDGATPLPGPCAWSMQDLEAQVTEQTRIVAVSHVQFTSGHAANLRELGAFCHERGIYLVVDAAQSLGCLPIRPEELNIAAVACSGWKWLLGPLGSGLLYTSPEFREQIDITMAGAEVVTQAPDYLDHRWQPHRTARMFEYSTPPAAGIVALLSCLQGLWNVWGAEEVRAHVFALQNRLLAELDPGFYAPLRFAPEHRSGIISLVCRSDPEELSRRLIERGVFATVRGGYLRAAPHIYLNEDDMVQAAEIMNEVAGHPG